MGLFSWWGKRRRLEKQLAELEERANRVIAELDTLKDEVTLTNDKLCSTLAALNVRMQAGQVWATTFNFHVEHLPDAVQVKIREATLRMLHQWHNEGIEVCMIQNPPFDFPMEKSDAAETTVAVPD